MFPMLEMSGMHARFISDVLYVYNMDNPINDFKGNVNRLFYFNKIIRNRPHYALIDGK